MLISHNRCGLLLMSTGPDFDIRAHWDKCCCCWWKVSVVHPAWIELSSYVSFESLCSHIPTLGRAWLQWHNLGYKDMRSVRYIPHMNTTTTNTLVHNQRKWRKKTKFCFTFRPVRPPLLRAPRAVGSFYRVFILGPVGNVFTSSSTLSNPHLSAYLGRMDV